MANDPQGPTKEAQQLDFEYRLWLNKYNKRATFHKGAHRLFSFFTIFAAWLILFLSVLALCCGGFGPAMDAWIRYTFIPWVSVASAIIIGLQILIYNPQQLWLEARSAAERMCEVCMLYRAKVPPFDGSKRSPERELKGALDEIYALADGRKKGYLSERCPIGYFTDLIFGSHPELDQEMDSTPYQGILPRIEKGKDTVNAMIVLNGRLQDQRKWHRNKARLYLVWWLVILIAVFVIHSLNAIWAWVIRDHVFQACALASTFSLALYNIRDSLGLGLLTYRYTKTVGNLTEIEKRYVGGLDAYSGLDPYQRAQRLAEDVEMLLAREFQFWYASRHS